MGQTYMLVGPTAVGKTTLRREVKQKGRAFGTPVSFTTRDPKPGEVPGVDYYYTDVQDFIHRRETGFFAESATVHGNLYGTPLAELVRLSSLNQDTIFDVDVQGAKQLKDRFPSFHMIFIVPPSLPELRSRILARNRGESPVEIETRLASAILELHQADAADWLIENNNLIQATSFLYNLILQLSNGEKPSMMRFQNPHLLKRCLSASWG